MKDSAVRTPCVEFGAAAGSCLVLPAAGGETSDWQKLPLPSALLIVS